MHALVFNGTKDLSIVEREKPTPKPGEALIKVGFAGICGSDMHIYHGTHPRAKAPLIMGHEFSGVIEAINGEQDELKIGDKVVVYPLVYCGQCPACKTGHVHVCETLRLIGIDSDGAFGEYAAIPLEKIYKIPDDMDLKEAAIVEPLAVTVHALRESNFKLGDTVVVAGLGPIGTLMAETCRAAGASKVIVFDVVEEKVQKAASMGFIALNSKNCDIIAEVKKLTGGFGADMIFDCSGAPIIADIASKLVRVRGQIVVVAVYNNPPNVNYRDAGFKELNIIGVRVYRFKDYDIAIHLIHNKLIDVNAIISHVLPLSESPKGFTYMDDGVGVKILIDMQGGTK